MSNPLRPAAEARRYGLTRAKEPTETVGYWSRGLRSLLSHRWAMFGVILVVLSIALALLAPVLAPYTPTEQPRDGLSVLGEPLAPGSENFLLGTDALGRDVWSRLLFGARVSLTVGIGANLVSAFLGIIIGGGAAVIGGWAESVLMRAVDVILSIPTILIAVAILAVSSPNVLTIVLLIGVTYSAYLSRLVFTNGSVIVSKDYVLVARSVGVKNLTILFRHVVPHVLPTVLVFSTLGVGLAVQLEAALSFVGVGIQPPDPSWGNMIGDAQAYLRPAPWLMLVPGLAIVTTTTGFILLGDGLRDSFDPNLQPVTAVR